MQVTHANLTKRTVLFSTLADGDMFVHKSRLYIVCRNVYTTPKVTCLTDNVIFDTMLTNTRVRLVKSIKLEGNIA